jgi:hypothetical protein
MLKVSPFALKQTSGLLKRLFDVKSSLMSVVVIASHVLFQNTLFFKFPHRYKLQGFMLGLITLSSNNSFKTLME